MKDNFEEHSDELNYKNVVNYSTDEIRDEELYTEKDTRALKELPNMEGFTSNISNNANNTNNANNANNANKLSINTVIGLILLVIIVVFICINKFN